MTEPKTVDIWRAQPVGEHHAIPVTIRIHAEMPDLEANLSRATFADDANVLADAIYTACTGGTVDALLAELLTRRASLLRVLFRDES